MAKFPNDEELKKIRKASLKWRGSRGLLPHATALEKAKYEVCQQIVKFINKNEISQRELASILEVPETRISEVVHYHIDKYTFDKLFSYLLKLKPNVKLRVA